MSTGNRVFIKYAFLYITFADVIDSTSHQCYAVSRLGREQIIANPTYYLQHYF